ncbi:hypothetical protein BBP40_006944 [Aspergillus hancockii]|nr:hypothetical protein BBP40_006944 [Aspergillus hancockii]
MPGALVIALATRLRLGNRKQFAQFPGIISLRTLTVSYDSHDAHRLRLTSVPPLMQRGSLDHHIPVFYRPGIVIGQSELEFTREQYNKTLAHGDTVYPCFVLTLLMNEPVTRNSGRSLICSRALPTVLHKLRKLNAAERTKDEAVQYTIKLAVLGLDARAIDDKQKALQKATLHASHYICQLSVMRTLSKYDPESSNVRVACVETPHAIPRRRTTDGSKDCRAVVLSTDQIGTNPGEQEQIRHEHPGEAIDYDDGQIFGCSVIRSFGDNHLNMKSRGSHPVEERTLRRRIFPRVISSSYLIAESVITTAEVRSDDFLILASDEF